MAEPELAPATSGRSASGFLVSGAMCCQSFYNPPAANPAWEQGTRGHFACGDRKRRNKTWVPKGTLLKSWGQGDRIRSQKSRGRGTDPGSPSSGSREAQPGLLNRPVCPLSRQAGAQHTEFVVAVVSLPSFKTASHSVAQAKPKLTAVLLGLQQSTTMLGFV